jgi:hypothetical protein
MDSVTFIPRGDVPIATGFYFNDAFTGTDVTQSKWISTAGSGSAEAVLTARAGTKPTGGIAGLTTAIDTPGNGALRLTNASNDQSAFVLFDQAFDSTKGVNVTFDFFSYGGSGADGISFFLIDGATAGATVRPGDLGGSLGYATGVAANGTTINPGLTKAYLGVGIDEFGNFSEPGEIGPGSGGPGRTIDSIAVRGKGDGTTGYQYLTGTGTLAAGIDNAAATTRGAAKRTVEIDLTSAGILNVAIDLNGDRDFEDPGERAITNFNIQTANGAAPATYKFGFSSSTGGSTNIHELNNLAIAASKASNGGTLVVPNTITLGEYGTGLTYVENAAPGTIAQGLTIEGNPTNINSATVKITGNFATGQDRLTIGGVPATASGTVTGTPITWVYDAVGGTLTFTGAGTAAQYQTALRQVAYANTSDAPTTGDRTIRYTLLNGTTPITLRDALVKINAVGDLPTAITLSSTSVPIGVAGAVVGNITVADPDGLGGSYAFTVSDTRFEVVGDATAGYQLKLKAGQTITAGSAPITGLSVGLTDAGAPLPGTFNQTFTLTPGQRKAEIFWRNPNGTEVFWQLDNAKLVGGALINSPYDTPAWVLKGVADMDGDGIKDHIYQNSTTLQLRYLPFTETNSQTTGVKAPVTPTFNNAAKFGTPGIVATPGAGWDLVGVENVSGTAQADLIFYSRSLDRLVYWETNATGQIVDAGFFTSTQNPGGQGTGAPNTWKVEAVADFTGDGKVDFLWRNTAGIVVLWKALGTVIDLAASQVLPSVPTGYQMRGVGDFNGDGIKDVVWRDLTANLTRFWTFNTSGIATQTADSGAIIGPGFQISAIADINGDGKSDLVWRDTVSDRSVIWNFNLGPNPGPTLQISSVLAGTDYVRNFLPGVTANVPYVNGDRTWSIDAANGIV